MDYSYLNSKMKNLYFKHQENKDFLNGHIQKINNYKINRLPFDSKCKCSSKNCPKKACYSFGENYYCWFHRIDLNIKNNFNF